MGCSPLIRYAVYVKKATNQMQRTCSHQHGNDKESGCIAEVGERLFVVRVGVFAIAHVVITNQSMTIQDQLRC